MTPAPISKYNMKKLTVLEIVELAGGIFRLYKIGINSENKYFMYAIDTITEQLGWAHHLKLHESKKLDDEIENTLSLNDMQILARNYFNVELSAYVVNRPKNPKFAVNW